MDNTQEFTCLSLCSGYGGLELGLKRACPNVRTVAYVEVEAFACANLVSKMEKGLLDAAPIWTDIKTFNGWPFRKNIHIITAGYPCQPFSVAGKRKGTADPRHLWPYIERILEAVRPVWCFFENVSGHLAIGFPEVYRSLRNMGYTVEAGLFTAAECGAPHRRERLFILGKSTKYGLSAPTLKRSIGQAISDNPKRQNSTCEFEGTDTTRKLADSNSKGLERADRQGLSRRRDKQLAWCNAWPARPGQPQYEWEEPRVVVGNAKGERKLNRDTRTTSISRAGLVDGEGKRLEGVCEMRQGRKKSNESGKRQTESQLGRTANGTNCRVDRLRLLGNGVVPQQAEKAFRHLLTKAQEGYALLEQGCK